MSTNATDKLRVAIDTGGTFTDIVARCGPRVEVMKIRSTPEDPSEAVVDGLRRICAVFGVERAAELIHGTTVATNALLERSGKSPRFVTNAGFEDLLQIGRQARTQLYALEPEPRPVLVERARCLGVGGRRAASGEVVVPLDLSGLQALLATLGPEPESWAICTLHSYADPEDEERIAEAIRAARPDDSVSVSSEVLPVFREVERASTTVANAFIQPRMRRYLRKLDDVAARVWVMGSSGGRLPLHVAVREPIHTALSGPAGGVVAAQKVADLHGLPGVVSFDMGGTSTDVALCRGGLPIRYGSEIGAYPIHVPMLDIHTVGAGGGSVAFIDDGGALRVGPRSAGAKPGPACYGVGTEPTVTDANVVLGRLPGDAKLGGHMAIDRDRALAAVEALAQQIGTDVERAARGILRIATERMAQAVRKVSVERGIDPRDYPLCAFGGAGGLHACELAEELGMREVIVPAHAGLLSAVGMLVGAAIAERSQTMLGRSREDIVARRGALIDEVAAALDGDHSTIQPRLEMRYAGQSFELSVPFEADMPTAAAAFEEAHLERFGYRLDASVEPVTLRIRGESGGSDPLPGDTDDGTVIDGPSALVGLSDTIWIAPGWRAESEYGGWRLRRIG